MPAGTSVAISDAVGSQAVTVSRAGLRCSGNDLRPAVRPTVRNPSQGFAPWATRQRPPRCVIEKNAILRWSQRWCSWAECVCALWSHDTAPLPVGASLLATGWWPAIQNSSAVATSG